MGTNTIIDLFTRHRVAANLAMIMMVLAGLWAVSDETASLWMHEFYRNYFEGRSIGESYRSAAMTVREQFPSAYHWAAFAVYGAG